ncbi:cobalt ECF transporter T component CbiQ [Butyrivibrio sp. XBB1001]|uniref:cobalt ECF transporter T component CbiQ n=1 Tax=Butyrivibrio sp. XBB1001 TaxID=1280682 RepID=UPI000418FB07|nr:cobalt ECF transporter T component CbiQ [Butyrivibrio sp. XBB1001]
MNSLHPLGKLLLSVLYIFTVVSFNKYALAPLIVMSVYPFFSFIVGELSFKEGIYRMRLILPLVLFVGVFNPFLDRQIVGYIGKLAVSGGVLSMITVMIKGFYSVLAVYILIATTSIDDICYALRVLHFPRIMVIVVMLIYRYFGVMAVEADRIMTAYKLRAPSQNGINYKAWGTLVGQWLLRSMDKAERVYESMLLRGFTGDFRIRKKKVRLADIFYPVIWIVIFVVIRHSGIFGE